jgi:preprotein translocase subunit Sss1
MVTFAWDEDKYTSGFTILKHAATGLILIGIAWFIVSIIFWLVNILAKEATPDGSNA